MTLVPKDRPSSSGVVVMESLYSDYYRKRYLAARRIIP